MTVRRRPTVTCRYIHSQALTPPHIQLLSFNTLIPPPRFSAHKEEIGFGGRSGTPFPGSLEWAGPRTVDARDPRTRRGVEQGQAEEGGGTWGAGGVGRVGRNYERTPAREAGSAGKT